MYVRSHPTGKALTTKTVVFASERSGQSVVKCNVESRRENEYELLLSLICWIGMVLEGG